MNLESTNFVFFSPFQNAFFFFFLLISSITILIGWVLLIVDYDNITRLLK